jgi:uncharacterized protein (TIGR02611 family)
VGARPLPSGSLSTSEPQPKSSLLEKLHERRDAHKQRSKIVRALYVVVGATLLLAGLAMLVLPGPAFAVIPIGLFLLALEFTWAEAVLQRSLEQADKARQKAAQTTTTQRVLSGVGVALAVAGVIAWAILGDIPVVPV